jgi:hypothetical protein
MLKLQRIMEIAEDHARHCCSPGSPNGEHHNIQVLSVAIQEALSENDENKKPLLRGRALRKKLNSIDAYTKSNGADSGS